MPHNDEELLTLGALLHDIGKFRERTFDPLPSWADYFRHEARYSHEAYSALFVEEWLGQWPTDLHSLRRLVLKHHNPSLPDEQLVSLADRLSANERAEAEGNEEGARGRAESTLRTVLSRVELDGRHSDAPMYHRLVALSLERQALFPEQDVTGTAEAYRTLWQAFTQEMTQVPRGDLSTLLALLRKYTWAIPSDTRYKTIPDVSLYHHLKTTAAIAACLAREGFNDTEVQTCLNALNRLFFGQTLTPTEENLVHRPLCALVKGDISGTQDFLYLLTSSGAARGLRGRSFYLQLLTEVIAAWILRRLVLPATNLLFAGGGHFYLLLPYQEISRQFDTLRQQLATKLWHLHKGDLALTVDFVSVAAVDFLEGEAGGNVFASKWDEVSQRVNERKQRKWYDLGPAAMLADLFTPQQHGATAEEMCQVCHSEWRQGVDTLDDDVRKCRRCSGFEDLGRLLRDPTHLVVFTVPEADLPENPNWHEALRAFGSDVWLVCAGEATPSRPTGATEALVYTLDGTDFLSTEVLQRFTWDDLSVRYDFRLLPNATPLQDDGSIAEFSHLAGAAEGVKWLGVLRMDVDSLGEVFRQGLGQDATISRLSTLSESLRLFFEGWVPRICREYNRAAGGGKDALYLIYAGGDDLFVVGAWSVLPALAERLRQDFQAFVGGHHVTLSGGIAIEYQKFPLYQLADDAKHALDDQAKEFRRPNGGRPKDALCFLQTPLGWERFAEVAAWQQKLQNLLKPDAGDRPVMPRALLARLSEIFILYSENAKREKKLQRQGQRSMEQMQEMMLYDKWRWRLTYQLSRFGERYKDHHTTINALQQAILHEPDGLIAVLHLLARWTALRTREE
jgi:CRISPR-associated protein Csm1